MTDNETTPGAVDRLTELVEATEGDRRARRRLLDRASRVLAADAEAERQARIAIANSERRARSVEIEAEARIKAAEARLRVQERERAARQAEREAERVEQTAVREAKTEASDARRDQLKRMRETLSAAAPASLSMIVYLAAVASAVFGQVSVATERYGWSLWRALILAGFIELMALAMALTANRLRLRGERALAPRVLTWVFAGFAAIVNVWGHLNDPLMAAGLGAASLGGITLWEIRSSARHRDALRQAGQLAQPLPPLGLRFWLLQPSIAMAAYRHGVRTRVSAAAAALVSQAEIQHAKRVASARGRTARIWLIATSTCVFGVAMTILAMMTMPSMITWLQPNWWLTIAVVCACVMAIGAVVVGRKRQRSVSSSAEAQAQPHIPQPRSSSSVIPEPDPQSSISSPETADRSQSAESSSAESSSTKTFTTVQPYADVIEETKDTPRPSPTPITALRQKSKNGKIKIGTSQSLISPTNEFRTLTAPEHYGRDGITRQQTSESSSPSRHSTKPRTRRSGITDEAREWITECLRGNHIPTGPEMSRRYQVDPSTGRRWVRQVRDALES